MGVGLVLVLVRCWSLSTESELRLGPG
jgi:hypothetical protein